mgnify:CR=1 FL=1
MIITRNKDVYAAALKFAQARLCPPSVEQKHFDKAERTKLYLKAQEIFHAEAPWVPLAHSTIVRCYSKKLHDVPLRMDEGRPRVDVRALGQDLLLAAVEVPLDQARRVGSDRGRERDRAPRELAPVDALLEPGQAAPASP